jgi:uncharacterized membrane protein
MEVLLHLSEISLLVSRPPTIAQQATQHLLIYFNFSEQRRKAEKEQRKREFIGKRKRGWEEKVRLEEEELNKNQEHEQVEELRRIQKEEEQNKKELNKK